MCQSRIARVKHKRCPGLEHFENCLLVRCETFHLRTLKWEAHLSSTARTLWQERAEGGIDEVKENAKQQKILHSVFRFGSWKLPTRGLHSKILSRKKKTQAERFLLHPPAGTNASNCRRAQSADAGELDLGKAELPPLVKKLYPVSYRPWLKC